MFAGIAIAQQLPQLLGGFGALGAVLGLVVAAGAPLLSWMFDASMGAKTLDERLDELENRVDSVNDRLKILKDVDLDQTFGSMTDTIRAMTAELLKLDRAAELKTLRETLDNALKENIEPGWWQRGTAALAMISPADVAITSPTEMSIPSAELNKRLSAANYAELAKGVGPSFDDFTAMRDEIKDLAKSGDIEGVASRVCRDWDAATGTWVKRATESPAAAYREVLTHVSNIGAVGDDGLDLDQIEDWAAFCKTKDLTYNRILEGTDTTLRDVLTEIAAAGRATPRHDGRTWGVVIDCPTTDALIVDHVTPRNSWDFKWSRSYPTPPHAFVVTFLDAANDYKETQRVIRWPG